MPYRFLQFDRVHKLKLKAVTDIRHPYLLWLMLILGLLSCAPDSTPVKESEYPVKIVGEWIGKVGDLKEKITFDSNGKFIAQVRPMGFISNTLSQGTTGEIQGNWEIKGKVIILKITSAEDVHLLNKVTASTIKNFRENELVVKSVRGETSSFLRAMI